MAQANEKRDRTVTLECTDVQAPQLHHHEEQGERPRAHRDEEVLPVGPHATRSTRRPADAATVAGARRGSVTPRRCTVETDADSMAELVARRTRRRPGGVRRAGAARPTPTRYTLAYRLTGDEEDARDVVQEAYLRAYRGLKRFRGDAQFTTWLYRITANCASTHLGQRRAAPPRRARRRRSPVDDADPERRPRGPGRRRAPPRPRSATPSPTCRPGCGPSSCSATSTTCPTRRSPPSSGISESAAKVRLHRARRKLRATGCSRRRDATTARRGGDARAV